MGIFDLFRRRTVEFSDDENSEGKTKASIARLERKIRNQRVAFLRERLEWLKTQQEEDLLEEQIEEMERRVGMNDGFDAEEVKNTVENPETLFMQLIGAALSKKNDQGARAVAPSRAVRDEDMRDLRESLPRKEVERLQKLPDAELIALFGRMYPAATEQDKTRGIEILREKF